MSDMYLNVKKRLCRLFFFLYRLIVGSKCVVCDVRELVMQNDFYSGFNRCDIVVRLLAIENYYKKNNFGFDLYRKMQNRRIGKDREEFYDIRFDNLIKSYDKNGYDNKSCIELDRGLSLIDGSHRLALGIYHEKYSISALVRPYRFPVKYNIEWFYENNFTNEEIGLIQSRCVQMFDTINLPFVCILWSPVREYFDEITALLNDLEEVVDYKDYVFDQMQFKRIVNGVYNVDDVEQWKIDKKLSFMMDLSQQQYSIRLVKLKVKNPRYRLKARANKLLSSRVEDIKRIVRHRYSSAVENYFYDIIIHIGDNLFQNNYIECFLHINEKIKNIIEEYKGLSIFFVYDESTILMKNSSCLLNVLVADLELLNSFEDKLIKSLKGNVGCQCAKNVFKEFTLLYVNLYGYEIFSVRVFHKIYNKLFITNLNIKSFNNFLSLSDGIVSIDKKGIKPQNDLLLKLETFRVVCQQENIPLEKICIVGSSILSLCGIRDSHDIDFIVTSDIRMRYDSKCFSFNEYVELVSKKWARSKKKEEEISDDELIYNPLYHVSFGGFKFAQMPLLYHRKIQQARDKDIADIIAIKYFNC